MTRSARMRAASGLALLAAAAGLGGCMGSTYGTGERPGMAMFREMSGGVGLGLVGLGDKKKEPIEYQPRAPLVMPPRAEQLPEPAQVASAANPQWPVEPEKAGPRFGDDNARDDITPEEYRRLKPLGALNRGERGRTAMPDGDRHDEAYDVIANRKQRETFKAALDDKDGVGRTERRYLTEPPDTFREPASGAPTEFDDIKKKKKSWFAALLGG